MSASRLFPEPPTLEFRPPAARCPGCGSALRVAKIRTRTVRTLHVGPFRAREVFLRCGACGRAERSGELRALVQPGANFGYDVMVHAGKALFLRLCHLDATCEGGGPPPVSSVDSLSDIVPGNVKLPAEDEAHIVPFSLLKGCFRHLRRQAGIIDNPFEEIVGIEEDTVHTASSRWRQTAIAQASRFGYRVPVIRVRPNGPAAAGGMVADLPPTLWSVVARAGNRERETWTAALDQLVAAYRPMLVRHLVAALRLPADRAEDLVQAFLADRLLDENVLRLADRGKGRFRSFLLKAFSNFVVDELRRQGARKRSPTSPDAVRLDDLEELPADGKPMMESFDVLWARQVIARAVQRMREECRSKRREDLWEVLRTRVLGPLLDQADPMPYGQLVARFGLRSPSEAANLLITAKRMFARVLHETVRETVADDREVEAEIMELKRVLAK